MEKSANNVICKRGYADMRIAYFSRSAVQPTQRISACRRQQCLEVYFTNMVAGTMIEFTSETVSR